MKRLPLACGVAAAALAARVAIASEEGHPHEGGIPFATLTFSTINLAIFVWILARFVMPTVRAWVRERRDRVVRTMEEAAAAKAAALQLRAEWEARLAEFTHAVEELCAQARRDAEHERDRILEAARKAADAIRRDAERAAAYEVRRTQEEVRGELVRQALQAAEDTLRKEWSAADQQSFLAEFLKQVQP